MNKKWYNSRSFYGAFVFALALWGYNSLEDTYNTNINVPLKVILPENRALKSDLPPTIGVQFRGKGWDLFNISFFVDNLQADIDLQNKNLNSSKYLITKDLMLNSLKNLGYLEARNINSEQFEIYYGRIINKKVPLIANLNLVVKDGFKITSNVDLSPDSIILRGNEEILQTIDSWETEEYTENFITQDIEIKLKVVDSLSQIVEKDITSTNLKVEVSQLGNIILPDMKVKLKGGIKPRNIVTYPKNIDLTISAPLDKINNVNPDEIEIYIDYDDLISENGLAQVKVNIDDQFEILKIEPDYIYIAEYR
jgi:hypothetical protein